MTDQTIPNIVNCTPGPGTFIDSENQIIDLKTLLTGGSIVVTKATDPPTDPVIGEATVPRMPNITPLPGTFIANDNTINDFKALLESGLIKVQVSGSAGSNLTFLTSTDETATLPNSLSIADLPTGLLTGVNGTGEFSSVVLSGTANQIVVVHGDGSAGAPTFSLSPTLVLPGSLTLGGDLNLATHKVTSNSGTPIQLIPTNDLDGIELVSNKVTVEAAIMHAGNLSNNITFTTDQQQFNAGGFLMILNGSGLQIGSTGAVINNVSNSASETGMDVLVTAYATQLMIANALMGSQQFRGFWDASGGTFPTTGGTGVGGAIVAGNFWRISVGGTLGTEPVDPGDLIFAAVDTPGQTPSNWSIVNPRVSTVFGRVGNVVALDGDYPFNYITGLPDTATTGKLMRGNGTAWLESTSTFADTYNQYDILFASNNNTITGLAKASNSVLTTNLSSVPAWLTLGNLQFLGGSANGPKPFIIDIDDGLNAAYDSGSTPGAVTIGLDIPVLAVHGGTGLTSVGASGNVLKSNGSAWVSSAPVLPFNAVTTSTQALAINNVYYTTYAGLCTMTLPTTAAVGSIIRVRAGPSGNTFRVAQNANQYIMYGAQNGTLLVSATGTGGYIQSVDPATTVDFECIVANVGWMVTSNVNNLQVNA